MTKSTYLVLGTTTKDIADMLGLPKTLLGVDAIKKDRVSVKDVNEAQILEAIRGEGKDSRFTNKAARLHLWARKPADKPRNS